MCTMMVDPDGEVLLQVLPPPLKIRSDAECDDQSGSPMLDWRFPVWPPSSWSRWRWCLGHLLVDDWWQCRAGRYWRCLLLGKLSRAARQPVMKWRNVAASKGGLNSPRHWWSYALEHSNHRRKHYCCCENGIDGDLLYLMSGRWMGHWLVPPQEMCWIILF